MNHQVEGTIIHSLQIHKPVQKLYFGICVVFLPDCLNFLILHKYYDCAQIGNF